MKTILVPTDFSSTSRNALNYAVQLNKNLKASIVLFHTYNLPVYTTDIPVMVNESELIQEVKKQLEDTRITYEKSNPGMTFKTRLAEGSSWAEIANEEKRIKADLIIMGLNEASDLERFFGSTAGEVVKDASCPVLIIPSGSNYRPIEKVVFATDYAENDYENISATINLARLFNAKVILLHVSHDNLRTVTEYNDLESFRDQIQQETQYKSLEIKLAEYNTVSEGILLYSDEIKADLMAMSKRHLSALKRLFEKSTTKKVVYHAEIPTLVFHSEY